MLIESVWADVSIGAEHLRLFSERDANGVWAYVFNVVTKIWIAPFEPVEDIEQGKKRAASRALTYLKYAGYTELPLLHWKTSSSR
jgi:hypothetical protein